ncbi:S-layer homology domain-containing protein [Paenibacillus sp. OAE614]|uniref:S-layer homology domain-containing protein n=1 Tax=Paenibacillus sp. OAE614 TaxID=2663804 RepID=UPI00178A7547
MLLARALQLPEQTGTSIFEDVDDKDWYAAEVQSATKAGIIQGAGDGGFHPDRAVTRQEMALMISKSMTYSGKADTQGSVEQMSLEGFSDQEEIASWAHDAMMKIVQAGIMQGDQHGALRPDETCTRAEMAVMIVRMLKEIQFIN